MNYLTECLDCGQQLRAYVGDVQSAPWICDHCHLMFWAAELSTEVRVKYRGRLDFGYGAHLITLIANRESERMQAFIRGTSARDDQLSILSTVQLNQLLANKRINPAFIALVQAESKKRAVV